MKLISTLFVCVALTSCSTITVEHKGVKVEHKMFMQKVKSNTVNAETGSIKTEYYESNTGSILKYFFNWSVIKGVYDLVWN